MAVSVFVLSLGIGLSARANSTGTTTWKDNPVGAVWGDAANWAGGLPLSTEQARFTYDQTTTYDVIVNTHEVFRETLLQRGHTFNGTGSLTMEYAPDNNERILENNHASNPNTTYNVDVTMRSTSTDYYGSIYNTSALTFNGALVLTNTVSLGATSRVKMDASGTTTINGDFYHGAGIRLTAGTVVIGGSGTSSAESSTVMTLLGGALQLNRAGALDVDDIVLEGTEVTLGADNALLAGTDVRFLGGELLAEGHDQDFGWLLLGDGTKDTLVDMGSSDSIWTFEDSSSQAWGAGILAIANAENATIRFADTGLTDTQIGQITLNGSLLTTADTTLDGGYLYITPIPEPATVGLFLISALGLIAARRRFM
jgi:hypothetical protein